ncbi:MAG: DUF4097 family beta strand repeat-containing protein [Vicinamibacterales bacterium]
MRSLRHRSGAFDAKLRTLSALVAGALTLLVGGARADGAARPIQESTFERTVELPGDADLDVTTSSGSITVTPGPDGRARVSGRVRPAGGWRLVSPAEAVARVAKQPPVELQGRTLRVGYLDDDLQRQVTIDLVIELPAGASIRSRTGSGSQHIGDFAGAVVASTGSGEIAVGRLSGSLRVSTGSGNIVVDGAAGDFQASTGSGEIRAASLGGRASARSGSGNISLGLTGAGAVEASTGSGDITVRHAQGAVLVDTGSGDIVADGTPGADWRITAASGDVTLRISEVAFAVDARTSSGSLTTTHPVTVSGSVGRHTLKGSVRGGGPLIQVRTASGDIHVGQ